MYIRNTDKCVVLAIVIPSEMKVRCSVINKSVIGCRVLRILKRENECYHTWLRKLVNWDLIDV
jgi:hypothetical protein